MGPEVRETGKVEPGVPGVTPREAAVGIVRRLREAGHVAYLAGGCVRDALLGMEPKDYDVATDARPEVVRKLFPRSRYVGEAFGVCLVRVGEAQVEVATFRAEWGYADGRRPDHVEFTDAEHDAQRRDFTINGLFADPLETVGFRIPDGGSDADPSAIRNPPSAVGRVIDFVGGVADLEAGLVRAIGDPDARFAEDYLRMLRAVRFAARLGFEVEAKTAAAIRPLAKYLGQISRERIGQEVGFMLGSAKPKAWARAVELMQTLRLDGVVLNEDHREAGTGVLAALDSVAAYPTRLAAWAIDRYVGPRDLDAVADFVRQQSVRVIDRWRGALCLSNDDRDGLRGVLLLVERAAAWEACGVAKRKRLLAEPLWSEAERLLRALDVPERLNIIERDAAPLVAEGVAPTPLVTGDDLVAMGLKPGPAFGTLLDAVYDAQLEGRVATKADALAWVAGLVEGRE